MSQIDFLTSLISVFILLFDFFLSRCKMLHILSVRGHYYMMFVCSCSCRCECLSWLSLVPTLKCEHLRVCWLIFSFLFKPLFLSQKVFTMFMMALNIARLEICPRLIFGGVASVQVFIYLCIWDLFIAVMKQYHEDTVEAKFL